MSNETTILQVDNLSTGYGGNIVLQDVSFQIGKGEVLAIIGQNGSGKSTLLKSLSGLLPIKNGSVNYNGGKLKSLKPHTLAKQGISYFVQGGLIIPSLTTNEHLDLAAHQSGKNLSNGISDEVYGQFPGLRHLRHERAGNLSGGERQMLSFAILVVQDTNLWFLDEPTAGLSPEMVSFTSSFLKKRSIEKNITLLLVEHNLEVAFYLASHVIVAKNGTLSRKFEESEFKSRSFLKESVYN